MAKYTRWEVFSAMEKTGLVPLFYHADVEVTCQTASACAQSGAKVIEFTNRGDFAAEVFKELSRFVRAHGLDLALGVGSVQDGATAAMYMQLGADFIVTPSLRRDVATMCNRRKVAWLPGCATLTEIGTAEEWGAEIVKIFPGGVLGPGFVKAVRGPCPWTRIMPTGGVTADPENLRGWFAAGVTCVGMGSALITKQILADRDFSKLAANVKASLELIQTVRSSSA